MCFHHVVVIRINNNNNAERNNNEKETIQLKNEQDRIKCTGNQSKECFLNKSVQNWFFVKKSKSF